MPGCSKLGETNLAAITAANLIILKDRTSLAEDEPALLARAKAGDWQALSALYHEHAGRIYSLSLRVTEDVNAAENLTRDIFVEAFTGLDAVTDDAAFAANIVRRSRIAGGVFVGDHHRIADFVFAARFHHDS